eukprot:6203079-Pleurochrysis_carterae.AAC.2
MSRITARDRVLCANVRVLSRKCCRVRLRSYVGVRVCECVREHVSGCVLACASKRKRQNAKLCMN